MADTSEPKRPGRPAGASDSRERILSAARELFAGNGINATSIRSIAGAAGVDPALVHHYFGTKQQLFAAAIELPIDPAVVLEPLRTTPITELGHALPTLLLGVWDSELGTGLIATLRSILAGADVSLARAFFREVVVGDLSTRIDRPAGTGVIRAELVATQLIGVVMARYIVGLEPLASLPAEQLVALIAPNLQRYFTGDLSVERAP